MNGLELWWLGQSGFRLRNLDGSSVVFLDPFLTDDPERSWPAPVEAAALARADAVLCSHEHIDHFDRPALRKANQVAGADFKLVVPEPIVPDALELGIPRERIIGAQPGQTIRLDGLQVHPVRAKHGIHMTDAYSFGEALSGGEVRYLGYVVELGGVRAYHAGDTIPYPGQVDDLRPLAPHLAMLPINGRDFFREHDEDLVGNMDPREAAHTAVDIGAEVLIPMHWELFAKNRGFPRDLVAYAASELPQLTVLVFGRGAKVIYKPPD
jgi:L-ascorbate metabolism protein UlaG (beta-lactamase superfamily)